MPNIVKTDVETESGSGAAAESGDGGRTYADYSYESLIQRVADIIHAKNPELTEKKRTTMKPPMLMRVGTKKTLWANFQDICKSMRRNPEHVYQVYQDTTCCILFLTFLKLFLNCKFMIYGFSFLYF